MVSPLSCPELQSALPAERYIAFWIKLRSKRQGQRVLEVRMSKVRLVLNTSHLAMIWGGP